MIKKIILILFSSFLTLICCEILVRFIYPQNLKGYYMEQNQSGLWKLKNNYKYYDRFKGKTYIYKTGSYRNRLTNPKKTNKEQVLILGDSFTFGYRLSDEYTYVERLQNEFPEYYFVNSASPNWGLSDYTRFVEDYCEDFESKKIIIFLNTDDIGRVFFSNQYWLRDGKIIKGTQGKYNAWYVKYYEYPIIGFLSKNSHLVRFTAKAILDISRLRFNNMGQKITSTTGKEKILFPKKVLQSKEEVSLLLKKTKLILYRLKEKTESCGLKLNFIYSGWVDFNNDLINFNVLNPNVLFFKNSNEIFKTLNIKFYNNSSHQIMKDVNLNRIKYIIQDDHHPNKLGSKRIFEVVKDDIATILEY